MSDKPYVTIITSTYNAADTLRRCLDSVNSQTFTYIEHIIIDGGSTDGTQDIISYYASKDNSKISYWISETDTGIYNAWNKALPHVHGEWVLFLGADDYYCSNDTFANIVPKLVEYVHKTPIIYGQVYTLNSETGKITGILGINWDKCKRKFLQGRISLPHAAVFHHKNIFKQYGCYNDKYIICGDYDFLYPILLNNDPIFVEMPIALFSDGGISNKIDSFSVLFSERKQTINKYHGRTSLILGLRYIKSIIFLFCENHNLKFVLDLYIKLENIYRPILLKNG